MPELRAFGAERPPVGLGLAIAAAAVAIATTAIYPLKTIAPVVSLSVVYLPAILLVSVYWGLVLGLLTSLASAAAFNYFHLPPTGEFTISDSRNWAALAAFVLVAAVVSTVAEMARSRALEAERRRGEADLAAGLARDLLSGSTTQAALGATARHISQAMVIPSAAIQLGEAQDSARQHALPLRDAGGVQIATLLVPRSVPADTMQRLTEHVVPSLAALVGIALHRDAVQSEAVETAALRRSDEIKTALLRSVSHDLRTPITGIVAAGHALGGDSLRDDERTELSAAVVEEGQRLSDLVDKLLDLSRLQAGRADAQPEWISVEEVLLAARDGLRAHHGQVQLSVDPDLPLLRADAAQLTQVFANLLENAVRYSGGSPVSVRVRRSGDRALVRIVDQGPGIPPAEQERIFEPFYRGQQGRAARWTGSGLGLAIAKGFVEANGGEISVESLPGQGTSFVVELPLPQTQEALV
jgi:two-component system sensor histidine kinase KdpD